MTATVRLLSARFSLREATQDLHTDVDAAFAAFDISEAKGYRAFLSAHARVVPQMEHAIDAAGGWSGWSPRTAALAADLMELGAPAPLIPATAPLSAAAAWGLQYVLEGSKLGGAMMLRALPAGLPRRYLGAVHEAGAWAAFQAELQAASAGGGETWTAQATAAARDAFHQFRQAVALELASAGE